MNAVGAVVLDEVVDRVGDLRRRADERSAPELSMTSSRMLRSFASAISRHFATVANRSWCTSARPWMIERRVDVGVDVGQRAVGVVRRQVAVPDLLEQQDRRLRR